MLMSWVVVFVSWLDVVVVLVVVFVFVAVVFGSKGVGGPPSKEQ